MSKPAITMIEPIRHWRDIPIHVLDVSKFKGLPTIAECHAMAAQLGVRFIPHSQAPSIPEHPFKPISEAGEAS